MATRLFHGLRLAAILFLFVAAADSALAQEWTRFRGPNGSGESDATTIPAKWTDKDYNWKINLPGAGHSSPVLWGDKIFLDVRRSAKRHAIRPLHLGRRRPSDLDETRTLRRFTIFTRKTASPRALPPSMRNTFTSLGPRRMNACCSPSITRAMRSGGEVSGRSKASMVLALADRRRRFGHHRRRARRHRSPHRPARAESEIQ